MGEAKKLIIFEPDAERVKTLEIWLKELSLDFVIEGELKNLESALLKEKFACLLLSLRSGTDSSLRADPALTSALALLRTLKTSAPTQDMTAILVTSQGAVDLITSAINAGADNILIEGANKDQFLNGLKELLKRIKPAQGKKRYKVCGLLKADTRYGKIPIIILTARAQESDEKFGLECGADAYIIKPFQHEVVLAKIKELLKE